jgi:hypothetical protein
MESEVTLTLALIEENYVHGHGGWIKGKLRMKGMARRQRGLQE